MKLHGFNIQMYLTMINTGALFQYPLGHMTLCSTDAQTFLNRALSSWHDGTQSLSLVGITPFTGLRVMGTLPATGLRVVGTPPITGGDRNFDLDNDNTLCVFITLVGEY